MKSLIIISLVSFMYYLMTCTKADYSAYAAGYLGMPISVSQAIKLVEKRNLTDCVSRTICEMSCNQNVYGEDGVQVVHMFEKFQDSHSPMIKQFLKAECRGLRVGNCSDCYLMYTQCTHDGKEIIDLAKKLHINPDDE